MFPTNLKIDADSQNDRKNRTVIAHISDLHFTAVTDTDDWIWKALTVDLKNREEKIDLLVVTGDLIDAAFAGFFSVDEASVAFQKVREYLQTLCCELMIDPAERLVVVPGNHDYRLKGIVNRRMQSKTFYDAFKDLFRPIFLSSLGVCIFVLDSNAIEEGMNLATGLVERKDLVEFFDFVNSVRTSNTAVWHSCTKIVLLHHHPMPIAATEVRGFLDQPGFVLLKNAAQLMTIMVDSEIDLILHGHQHYPAYSKVSFPTAAGTDHLLTVIGAGTVGQAVRTFNRSYNVITLTNNREIHLERRILPATKYETGLSVPIRTYKDARKLSFNSGAARINAKLKAKKFTRLYVIKSNSGDADQYERIEDLSSNVEDIFELPAGVNSASGFFYTPEYQAPENQSIQWVWKPGSWKPPKRDATVFFNPPLTKERSITFARHTKIYNLFHFNQREREDATNGSSKDEFIELRIHNAYDLLVITIVFPEGNFPERFYRVVHNSNCHSKQHDEACERDIEEEDFVNLHFSKLKEARTVVLYLEKPIPGYTYWIYWELPKIEEDEINLEAVDRGRALTLTKKLLQLMDIENPEQSTVRRWFQEMHEDIVTSVLWNDLQGDDELEISLYVYDYQRQGLVCVATSMGTPWKDLVKSGQSLIGAAYRRKEPMLFSPLARRVSRGGGELEYEHRVPSDWREASSERPYTAICAIPLVYPIPQGRKTAVLTFAARSNSSRLLRFVPQRSTSTLTRAAGNALVEDVMIRQFSKLAASLGVK